jgi:hypothetical protein
MHRLAQESHSTTLHKISGMTQEQKEKLKIMIGDMLASSLNQMQREGAATTYAKGVISGAEWMEQQPIELFAVTYHAHTGIGTINSEPEYYRTEKDAHEAYKDDLSVGMGVNSYSIKKIIVT